VSKNERKKKSNDHCACSKRFSQCGPLRENYTIWLCSLLLYKTVYLNAFVELEKNLCKGTGYLIPVPFYISHLVLHRNAYELKFFSILM